MPTKIIQVTEKTEIDAKRVPIPGEIDITCPHCGHQFKHKLDGDHRYISYPVINGDNNIYGDCPECDEYWSASITLRVSLEFDSDSVEKQ